MSFIFGGDTGLSYDELQRRRREINSRRNRFSAPRNVGEGLTALGIALSQRLEQGRINKAAEAGAERGETAFSAFQSILSGGSGRPTVSGDVPTGGQFADINSSLAHTESGGRYNIRNSEGYTGKYQFGQERLNDFNRANGSKYSTDDLLKSPELQETVQNWHIGDIDRYIAENDLSGYVGQGIGGVKLTQNSLRAMAHLGGNAGMKRFLQSGGRYNPSDSNGTSLLDYARTHAGAGGAQPVQVASADPQQALELAAGQSGAPAPEVNPEAPPLQVAQNTGTQRAPLQATPTYPAAPNNAIDPRMFELMASPDISPGQRAVMTLMLQQHMKANAPIDPLKQLQIRKLQQEMNTPPDRNIIEGADGFKYYQDTGERVLPGVEKPEDPRYQIVSPEQAQELGLPEGAYQSSPDGKISKIGGGGVNVNVGGFNNEQSKAAGFADRMIQSENVLRQFEDSGTSLQDKLLSSVPGGNFFTSDNYKLFGQAKRDFINAILRRESGAVISESEFDNADKQYFPQPGDTPEVIAQKRRNRENAIFGIGRAAGSSYEQPELHEVPQNEPEVIPFEEYFRE